MAALTATAAGSLGWYFCWFMAFSVLSKMFGKKLGRFIGRLGKSLASLRRSSDGEMVAGSVFVVLVVATLTLRSLQLSNSHVYEFQNVKVLRQVAHNKWWMSKDDGDFLYTGCDDFPNDKVIWPGYVARKVRWQELGNCKSI
jgi:hypothetical protein